MKKFILIIMLVALFMPITTYAFSWTDLLWWRNKEVVKKEEIVELNVQQKITAEEKLNIWLKAYKSNDLSLVANDDKYVNISEVELDYIIQNQLQDYKNSPIQDVKVNLNDGKIIIEGYALKPLKGKVYMAVRIEVMDDQLYFHVTKARYKGLFIPGSLVGRLIYRYLEPVSDFFFTDEGVKLRDVVISSSNIDFVIN